MERQRGTRARNRVSASEPVPGKKPSPKKTPPINKKTTALVGSPGVPEGASPEVIDGASPAVIHIQEGGADLSSGTIPAPKKNPVRDVSAKKPTSELQTPPANLNFTHWKHGK